MSTASTCASPIVAAGSTRRGSRCRTRRRSRDRPTGSTRGHVVGVEHTHLHPAALQQAARRRDRRRRCCPGRRSRAPCGRRCRPSIRTAARATAAPARSMSASTAMGVRHVDGAHLDRRHDRQHRQPSTTPVGCSATTYAMATMSECVMLRCQWVMPRSTASSSARPVTRNDGAPDGVACDPHLVEAERAEPEPHRLHHGLAGREARRERRHGIDLRRHVGELLGGEQAVAHRRRARQATCGTVRCRPRRRRCPITDPRSCRTPVVGGSEIGRISRSATGRSASRSSRKAPSVSVTQSTRRS